MFVDPRFDGCGEVKVRPVRGDTLLGHCEIVCIQFDADAVAAPSGAGEIRGAGSHERIENSIADEREHANEALGEFDGIRGGMFRV